MVKQQSCSVGMWLNTSLIIFAANYACMFPENLVFQSIAQDTTRILVGRVERHATQSEHPEVQKGRGKRRSEDETARQQSLSLSTQFPVCFSSSFAIPGSSTCPARSLGFSLLYPPLPYPPLKLIVQPTSSCVTYRYYYF